MTERIHDYIAQQRRNGVDEATIKHELLSSGWSAPAVDSALKDPVVHSTTVGKGVNKMAQIIIVLVIIGIVAGGMVGTILWLRASNVNINTAKDHVTTLFQEEPAAVVQEAVTNFTSLEYIHVDLSISANGAEATTVSLDLAQRDGTLQPVQANEADTSSVTVTEVMSSITSEAALDSIEVHPVETLDDLGLHHYSLQVEGPGSSQPQTLHLLIGQTDKQIYQISQTSEGLSITMDFSAHNIEPNISEVEAPTVELPDDISTDTDSDGDGILDYAEQFVGTDPTNPDSDNDGFSDGEEYEAGFNPLGEGEL